MIELSNVSYSYYKDTVLNSISLRIEKGDAIAICGDNGSGKSTFLKLLNGIIFPQSGSYKLNEEEITEKQLENEFFSKKFHQQIGFIWQNPDIQLFCGSVEEELAFGPQQMGLSNEETQTRVNDALELLDLQKLRKRPPYFLSGGEKKKTAIASILTMNPEIWTLDEPLSSLDTKTRLWLVDFLQALKHAGKTLIFSSHEPELVKALASKIYEINEQGLLSLK